MCGDWLQRNLAAQMYSNHRGSGSFMAPADGPLHFSPGTANSSVAQSENARIAGERKV